MDNVDAAPAGAKPDSAVTHYVFSHFVFCNAFCGQTIHPTEKVSEGTNRNMPARNTLVKLLALYTDPESHNAQHHRQTDGWTDRQMTG